MVILLKPLGKYHAIEAYMLPIIASKEIFHEKFMKNGLDCNEAKLSLDEGNISHIFPRHNWLSKKLWLFKSASKNCVGFE